MSLKKSIVISSIIIFLLNFPLHFLYDFLPSFITSMLAPVNESIFEHMKMIFSSFWMGAIVYSLFDRKKDFFHILFSFLISSIVCIGLFLLIYIPIYMMFKENLLVTIILLFISIFFSQIVCYYILNLPKIKYQKWFSLGILVFSYLIIFYFTYYPPTTSFFEDPKTNSYGLMDSTK